MTVRTILVPLDGSPLAERALPYAEALARASGARLALVWASLVRDRPAADEPEARRVAEEEAYLAEVARRLAERGLDAETALRFADPAAAIVEEARAQDVDLLVMATHGRGGLGRWVYGSVAEAVLARPPAPILLVRAGAPGWEAAWPGERPRLLAPLDGSAFAEEALPVAESLAEALGGELVVVRAVPRPGLDFGPDWVVAPILEDELANAETEARDYLDRLAARLAREGRAAQAALRVGDPAGVIAAVGRERGAALVVMATHGHTGLGRVVLGSVADAVLRHGTLPLLLVRPQTLRDAE